MAPQMAARTLSCFCSVFCHSSLRFTRDELLNIKQHITDNIFLAFDYLDILLDFLVGGTAVLFKRAYRRRGGKRASALVKLCASGFRTALASIHIPNVRSLLNKTDDFCSLASTRNFQTLLLCVSWKPG